MEQTKRVIASILVAGLSIGVLATAWGAEDLRGAFDDTRYFIDWRLRYEGVDQTGISETADALTSRVRGGFETGELGRTRVLAEADWVAALVDDYNSTTNGNTDYPVVPDPAGYLALNRLAVINESLENTKLTFGRQRIILDDSRFVGNVGWRQHEQTFDGLRAELGAGSFDADLSYIVQVNRIFGPDSSVGEWEGDIVLGHLSREFAWGRLTGFAYLLDLDDAAALSSDTVGLRLTGAKPVGSVKATYTLSVARQQDAGDNPADFAENYYLARGGIELERFRVGLGFESLGGDGTNSVTMPLATLHAFQGWADKFLATPADGIDDVFLELGYDLGQVGRMQSLSVRAVYHDFDANAGGYALGEELDVSIVARTGRMAWTLKYAGYEAAAWATDTNKLWLSVDYSL